MKKLLVLAFISLLSSIPQLCSISFDEYRKQQGIPQITDGVLNLSNKNLTDLTGLQDIDSSVKNQIAILNFTMNQLTTLPADIFNGFNNLQRLALFGNRLTTLPTGIFNGLNSLQALGLNNNQLEELPKDIFNDLYNLHTLQLQFNQLTSVPTGIFNSLSNLRILDLAGNPLSSSFMPELIEILHSIPNDLVQIRLFTWPHMSKEETIKRLARTTAPHLLRNLPSDIREYYNIAPLE